MPKQLEKNICVFQHATLRQLLLRLLELFLFASVGWFIIHPHRSSTHSVAWTTLPVFLSFFSRLLYPPPFKRLIRHASHLAFSLLFLDKHMNSKCRGGKNLFFILLGSIPRAMQIKLTKDRLTGEEAYKLYLMLIF